MRALAVLRALQEIGNVRVLALNDEGTDGDRAPDSSCKSLPAYSCDVKLWPNRRFIEKLRWTLDPRSHYPHGCGVDAAATRRVLSGLDEFDLVWFFKLRSADMFPNLAWPRSVVDIDDIPSAYQRATLGTDVGLAQRFLTLRRLYSWRRREKLLGERFTSLSVCSEEDKQYLRGLGLQAAIHVIPNGFERPTSEPVRHPATPPRIGFIGLFDHFPNVEGIRWFIEKCWPLIKREIPDARLRLAGPGSDGPLPSLGPDIDGLGWVANPAEEIKTWSLMAIPIRVGAGSRVKIAHGFSQKCPIVSTSLGAYGYPVQSGREMYLADSAEAFSTACIAAIRKPEEAAQMAERGWSEFLERWTWDAITPSVWAAAEECLQLKRHHPTSARENHVPQVTGAPAEPEESPVLAHMTTPLPRVSIVTPVYNEAEYLSECIESVLSQTYTNWDYTVVDNCSTDGSAEIVRRYAARDSRIRLVQNQEFLRAIPNHNAALRCISPESKYCKVLFGDDWMFPQCLEQMVSLAEEQPSVGIVGAYSLQDEHVMWSGLPYPGRRIPGREICRRLFLEGLYVFGSATTVLYRSDLVRSRDPFYNESNFHADSEACIVLLKNSDFGFVHQVLTFQRIRFASLTTFSGDINTYRAGKLQELMLHGREFLSPEEFEACLHRMVKGYYEHLVGAIWRGRDNRFWAYHKEKLADVGVGFSRRRLARVALTKLFGALLNPKHSIEKFIEIRRGAKQAELGRGTPDSPEQSAEKPKFRMAAQWKAFKHGERM